MNKIFIIAFLILFSQLSMSANKQISPGKLDMSQFQFATAEQIASKRVDFSEADMKLMQSVVAAGSRILTKQSTIEKEKSILGEPDYFVPKIATQQIRSVSFDVGYLLRFPPENDWDPPSLFKGFGVGFMREKTDLPWYRMQINVGHLYNFLTYLPVTHIFLNNLGLTLIKTEKNQDCNNFTGQCNAFIFISKLYPGLVYTFLTDSDRSDLKSGLPTNFRTLKIEVIKAP